MEGTALDGANRALRQQAEVDFSAIVRFLQENLGPTVTAYMSGASKTTVGRWANQQQEPRSLPGERRLRGAYQVFVMLQGKESSHTIRAWFMGMNPQLDDLSPAEAIHDDRLPDVMSAARAFLAGG